jgi:prepilin-type N-terminal cleavage/methylation domain-containing protein
MFFDNKKNIRSGFTLVEILVVLVIMIALAMIVLSGYSEGRPRFALERTIESFIMDFHRTREKGFVSSLYFDGENLIEGNYGIRVNRNQNSYFLFIKNGSEGKIDVEEIKLEGLINILEIKKGGTIVEEVSISFSSEKEVYFDNNLASGDVFIIFSSQTNQEIQKKVQIKSSGLIEIIYL